jgi:hypothetical protein
VPALHEPSAPYSVGPITGDPLGRDQLASIAARACESACRRTPSPLCCR